MRTLVISGWNVGFDKVLLTKTLREEFGYSLSAGKSITERVLAKEEVRISLAHHGVDEEWALVKRLQAMGLQVKIEVGPV